MACEPVAHLSQHLITRMLVAAVLSGSLVAPAARHTHADGDVAHRHGDQSLLSTARHGHQGHVHHNSGNTHHRHDDDESEVPQPVDVADHTPHWHVGFLWFDFSFPQHGDPGEPLTPVDDEPFVAVRIAPEFVAGSTVVSADLLKLRVAVAVFTDRCESAEQPIGESRLDGAGANLLCDSARCERSGVLLI